MRSGIYVIGDPYLFFDTENGLYTLEKRIKKGHVYITQTGTRNVRDNFGMQYWIDSGWFGLLPVGMLRVDCLYSANDIIKIKGMRLVKFKKSFEPVLEENVLKFGRFVVRL